MIYKYVRAVKGRKKWQRTIKNFTLKGFSLIVELISTEFRNSVGVFVWN